MIIYTNYEYLIIRGITFPTEDQRLKMNNDNSSNIWRARGKVLSYWYNIEIDN
jgi:hypothetical protein